MWVNCVCMCHFKPYFYVKSVVWFLGLEVGSIFSFSSTGKITIIILRRLRTMYYTSLHKSWVSFKQNHYKKGIIKLELSLRSHKKWPIIVTILDLPCWLLAGQEDALWLFLFGGQSNIEGCKNGSYLGHQRLQST